jgi:hypothetical protein
LSKRDEHDVADALLAKAVGDEAGLRVLAEHPDVPDHVAGFLAQQAIEKSLKAVLTARGVLFERSHDIDYLCSLIEESGLPVTADAMGCRVPLRRPVRFVSARPCRGVGDRRGSAEVGGSHDRRNAPISSI